MDVANRQKTTKKRALRLHLPKLTSMALLQPMLNGSVHTRTNATRAPYAPEHIPRPTRTQHAHTHVHHGCKKHALGPYTHATRPYTHESTLHARNTHIQHHACKNMNCAPTRTQHALHTRPRPYTHAARTFTHAPRMQKHELWPYTHATRPPHKTTSLHARSAHIHTCTTHAKTCTPPIHACHTLVHMATIYTHAQNAPTRTCTRVHNYTHAPKPYTWERPPFC